MAFICLTMAMGQARVRVWARVKGEASWEGSEELCKGFLTSSPDWELWLIFLCMRSTLYASNWVSNVPRKV